MKLKPAYVIAFAVIAVCMIVTLFAFGGSMAHHVTIAQAIARTGETVQVPGDILKESVNYDPRKGALRFDIVDRKDPKQVLTVVYPEPKPENFDTATSVEAVGAFKNGVFMADRLLVKCPSKYNDQKPEPQPQKQASGLGPTELMLGGGALAAVAVATGFMVRRKGSAPGSDQEGRSV